jgi:peptidoglycan/LPS O-acetylase OafA/YrhL
MSRRAPEGPESTSSSAAVDTGAAGPARARTALPHVPAIDGLRAVAVTAVVLYHLPVGWLPGGFLGVDVFFVISGFLITSLVTAEIRATGRIDLRHFWMRRARRLLPALLFMLAIVIAVSSIFARDALSLLATDTPPVLGYFTNWWLIFHHVSYFQSVGRPTLVLHLWSLAVEEQFYLLWPVIVLLVVGHRGRTRRIGWVALVGAVASSVWMALLFHSSGDPSRVYFGTDTHAGGLLLGATLAVALPPWTRSAEVKPSARRIMGIAGMAAFAGLVALMVTLNLNQVDSLTYSGGIQLATVLSAVILVVVSHPAVRGARVLATPVMQWIGKRSYAIYLWHWPIFELTRPNIDVSLSGWPLTLVRLAVVAVASDLSYRLVEQPFRTGVAQSAFRRLWARRRPMSLAGATALAGILALLTVELTMAPAVIPSPALAAGSTPAARTPIVPINKGLAPGTGSSSSPAKPAPGTIPATTRPADDVLAIGDSVMLDAATDLKQDLGPATVVDAVVGRQVADGIARLTDYRDAGRLTSLTGLVIGLGTNGPMSVSQCQQILSLTSGIPRVVFVSVRMPRPWESITNNSLATCTARQPGVILADWYDASAAPGILGPDQIHSSAAGAALYASLISRVLSTVAPRGAAGERNERPHV